MFSLINAVLEGAHAFKEAWKDPSYGYGNRPFGKLIYQQKPSLPANAPECEWGNEEKSLYSIFSHVMEKSACSLYCTSCSRTLWRNEAEAGTCVRTHEKTKTTSFG